MPLPYQAVRGDIPTNLQRGTPPGGGWGDISTNLQRGAPHMGRAPSLPGVEGEDILLNLQRGAPHMGRASSLPGGGGGAFQQCLRVPRPDDWGTLMYFPGDPNPAEEATRYPRQVCRPRTGGSEEGAPPFPLVLVGGLGTSVQTRIEECRGPGLDPAPRQHALW